MSKNVLPFSQLIGAEETVHKVTINDRVILYGDPTLASLVAISAMQKREDHSFSAIYAAARKVFSGQRFEDNEPFTEAWLDGVTFGDFIFFSQFMFNPEVTAKPVYAEPTRFEGFRGLDVILPPVTLGNFKFFDSFQSDESQSAAEAMLEQLDELFGKATLADGSPLPEGLLHGLTMTQAHELIRHWINGPADTEVKAVKKAIRTGGRKKTGAGTRSGRSSRKPTASAPSTETPATSES